METKTSRQTDFEVIVEIIDHLKSNGSRLFDLQEISENMQLPIEEIEESFARWSGRNTKEFFHLLSREYISGRLNGVPEQPSLFDTIADTRDHQPSRLAFAHSDFCDIIPMRADDVAALRAKGVQYSFRTTPFGRLLIASSDKGVCYMAFFEDSDQALDAMKKKLQPVADQFFMEENVFQDHAMAIFSGENHYPFRIKLHLKGTDFQLLVWDQLLHIPFGSLTTYHAIATQIGKPKAYRAVGTAIAQNWIAYILPCHRIIRAGGDVGQYMWGSTRKNAIIGWEAARVD